MNQVSDRKNFFISESLWNDIKKNCEPAKPIDEKVFEKIYKISVPEHVQVFTPYPNFITKYSQNNVDLSSDVIRNYFEYLSYQTNKFEFAPYDFLYFLYNDNIKNTLQTANNSFWNEKDKKSKKRYVLFAASISERHHFVLYVADFVQHSISYFDSVNCLNENRVFNIKVVAFFDEYFTTSTKWSLTIEPCPQQCDVFNCGVFVCMFSKFISQHIILSLLQVDQIAEYRKEVVTNAAKALELEDIKQYARYLKQNFDVLKLDLDLIALLERNSDELDPLDEDFVLHKVLQADILTIPKSSILEQETILFDMIVIFLENIQKTANGVKESEFWSGKTQEHLASVAKSLLLEKREYLDDKWKKYRLEWEQIFFQNYLELLYQKFINSFNDTSDIAFDEEKKNLDDQMFAIKQKKSKNEYFDLIELLLAYIPNSNEKRKQNIILELENWKKQDIYPLYLYEINLKKAFLHYLRNDNDDKNDDVVVEILPKNKSPYFVFINEFYPNVSQATKKDLISTLKMEINIPSKQLQSMKKKWANLTKPVYPKPKHLFTKLRDLIKSRIPTNVVLDTDDLQRIALDIYSKLDKISQEKNDYIHEQNFNQITSDVTEHFTDDEFKIINNFIEMSKDDIKKEITQDQTIIKDLEKRYHATDANLSSLRRYFLSMRFDDLGNNINFLLLVLSRIQKLPIQHDIIQKES